MKFRRRKDSRTKRGHRQKYTKIKIKEIVSWYTKTGLVFGFSKNQSLVAVIPGLENAEDTYSDNFFRIFSESYLEMSIKIYCKSLLVNYN